MNLTVLTAACSRPEAWKLCEFYMQRQTVQPVQWIVLDDDEPPTVCTMGQEYYYKPEFVGVDSLKNKVRFAIRNNLIKGEAVVFFENDDWYSPRWLEFCADKLERYDMIGEGRAFYWNARDRFWNQHVNMQHASLCATAVRASVLPHVAASCNNPSRWIDDILWQRPIKKMVFDPIHTNSGKPLTVGIKGMPGRVGYGYGHVHRSSDSKDDLTLDYLRWLIGNDADAYAPFYKKKSLANIYDKYKQPQFGISDKGTTHSYVEEYEKLFAPFRERQPINILEIGLMRGGSLRMWYEYFDKSFVRGIDIAAMPDGLPDLQDLMAANLPRMAISILDATKPNEVWRHLGDTRFDIIIEDASHTISDSQAIYENFIPRLNPGGLYIIEDVENIDASLPVISRFTDGRDMQVVDLRTKKGRFDDVLVIVK